MTFSLPDWPSRVFLRRSTFPPTSPTALQRRRKCAFDDVSLEAAIERRQGVAIPIGIRSRSSMPVKRTTRSARMKSIVRRSDAGDVQAGLGPRVLRWLIRGSAPRGTISASPVGVVGTAFSVNSMLPRRPSAGLSSCPIHSPSGSPALGVASKAAPLDIGTQADGARARHVRMPAHRECRSRHPIAG